MIVKNVEKKENSSAFFQVETSAAEFDAAVNGAYLKNKKDIYIPGFRKGKAPRAVVEGMYGKEVFYQDAMDELAPKAFEFGMTETQLKIVGAPAIADVNITEEPTVVYTFAVTLYPEVTLGQYKGLEAVKKVNVVSEEAVTSAVDEERAQNARMIAVEGRAAEMGDTADIDFDGYLNGERFDGGKAENYSLELGSNSFVPGFEEQIVGMQIGEEKDIDITFPDNYTPELAGKAVVFKVKLNNLSVAELPVLDDEFVKDVSEFDTVEEYKEDIRKEMQARLDEQTEGQFRTEVIKKACENMTVEVPEVMITDKIEEVIRNYAGNFGLTDRSMPLEKLQEMLNVTDETISTSIRPTAEFQVKSEILLNAVIEEEKIEVTEEDIEAYIKKIAEGINAKPEDIKSYFGNDFVTAELKKEKATAIIVDSAVVLEEEKAE